MPTVKFKLTFLGDAQRGVFAAFFVLLFPRCWLVGERRKGMRNVFCRLAQRFNLGLKFGLFWKNANQYQFLRRPVLFTIGWEARQKQRPPLKESQEKSSKPMWSLVFKTHPSIPTWQTKKKIIFQQNSKLHSKHIPGIAGGMGKIFWAFTIRTPCQGFGKTCVKHLLRAGAGSGLLVL